MNRQDAKDAKKTREKRRGVAAPVSGANEVLFVVPPSETV
jgi:hypothetical protein